MSEFLLRSNINIEFDDLDSAAVDKLNNTPTTKDSEFAKLRNQRPITVNATTARSHLFNSYINNMELDISDLQASRPPSANRSRQINIKENEMPMLTTQRLNTQRDLHLLYQQPRPQTSFSLERSNYGMLPAQLHHQLKQRIKQKSQEKREEEGDNTFLTTEKLIITKAAQNSQLSQSILQESLNKSLATFHPKPLPEKQKTSQKALDDAKKFKFRIDVTTNQKQQNQVSYVESRINVLVEGLREGRERQKMRQAERERIYDRRKKIFNLYNNDFFK